MTPFPISPASSVLMTLEVLNRDLLLMPNAANLWLWGQDSGHICKSRGDEGLFLYTRPICGPEAGEHGLPHYCAFS